MGRIDEARPETGDVPLLDSHLRPLHRDVYASLMALVLKWPIGVPFGGRDWVLVAHV